VNHKIEKQFYAIGISYKNADLATRGKFNLNQTLINNLLIEASAHSIKELLVLSTCNRTEIYGVVKNSSELLNLLCKYSSGSIETFKNLGYILKNEEAYSHLFRVGTGLDSQILGDFEIIGQIKKSFYLSKNKNITNTNIERLINSVIQASKRIKTETNISTGATSLSFASVQYIIKNIEGISEKKILLFGTGKIGRNTCENLIKHTKNDHIVLINRTKEKAEKVAIKFNVKVKDHGSLPSEISNSDILIVATSAQKPTVEKELIFNSKPLLILDLSMPSNVDVNVKELKNVSLINLDELSQMTDETLRKRKKHIPKAEHIIEEVKNEFVQWIHNRQFAPTIKAFKEKLVFQQKIQLNSKLKKSTNFLNSNDISYNMIDKLTGQFASYIKDNPEKANETISVIKNVFKLDIKSYE